MRMSKQREDGLLEKRKPWTLERRAAQSERMKLQHKEGKFIK